MDGMPSLSLACSRPCSRRASMQLRFPSVQRCVFRLGLLEDGDVGVGISPKGEEVLVGCQRPYAGGVGIRALRSSRLQGAGTRHAQMRRGSRPAVPDDAAVVQNFLELAGGGTALSGFEVGLPARVVPRCFSGLPTNQKPSLANIVAGPSVAFFATAQSCLTTPCFKFLQPPPRPARQTPFAAPEGRRG